MSKIDSTFITDLNPTHFNQNFGQYDQNTALYCAQLSNLAYEEESRINEVYLKMKTEYPSQLLNYSFTDNKTSDAQALLWCSKDFLVIAFRGTEFSIIKDWISDSKYWNYENNPTTGDILANMPPGHGGFRKSLINLITEENLFDTIEAIIKKTAPDADIKKFPVFLTGHSLGAAISQLFMECLDYKGFHFSGAYHFAPPLAVACSERAKMKAKFGDKVYDIVNYKDYVPRAGRNSVAHFGKFYRICLDGKIYKEPEAYIKLSFKEKILLKEIAYHKLENHIAAIKREENTVDKIEKRSSGKEKFPCMGEGIMEEVPCK